MYKAKSRKSYRFKKHRSKHLPWPDQPVLAKLCSDVIVPWGRRVFGARQKMFRNAQLARPLKQETGSASWQEISTFMLCFYCETLHPRPQRRKTEIQMFGHNYTESTGLLRGNTAALLQSLRSKSSCLKWHFKLLYCTTTPPTAHDQSPNVSIPVTLLQVWCCTCSPVDDFKPQKPSFEWDMHWFFYISHNLQASVLIPSLWSQPPPLLNIT